MKYFAMFGLLAALAITLGSTPAAAEMSACVSASRKDNPDDQIRLYTLCIESGGMRYEQLAGAYNNRGTVYMAVGRIDEAFSDFERSIHYDPDWGMAYFNRAMIHAQRGDLDAAVADIDEAVSHAPARIRGSAYAMRGQIMMQQGDCARAAADFDEAIDRERREAEPRRRKAWVLSTCPDDSVRNGEEAVELAERAVELQDSWRARDTLAAAYAEAGRFEDAVREQQAAVTALGGDGPAMTRAAVAERLALYQGGQAYRAP